MSDDIDNEPEWHQVYSCDGLYKRFKLYKDGKFVNIHVHQAGWGGYELVTGDSTKYKVVMSSNDLQHTLQAGYELYLKNK